MKFLSAPAGIGRLHTITVDLRVLMFAAVVSIGTGLLFGMVPATFAARIDLCHALRLGARDSAPRHRQWQATVVVAEIALSFVLLVAGGLLIRSLAQLNALQTGVRSDHLYTIPVSLSGPEYRTPAQVRAFRDEAVRRLESTSGIDSITAVHPAPLEGVGLMTIEVDGMPALPGEPDPMIDNRSLLPNYFSVMGIPLITGRSFSDAENDDSAAVAVVNRAMAQRFWSVETTLGKRIRVDDRWLTIIGVSENVLERDLFTAPLPTFYVPIGAGGRSVTFIVRSNRSRQDLTSAIREQIWSIDSDLPIESIQSYNELIARSSANERYRTTLINTFAAVAGVLASIGLYGVISRSVVYRRREFGIRIALGARRRDVVRLVLSHTVMLSTAGVAVGIVTASASLRFASGFLYGVGPLDMWTYAAVAIGLVGVSVAATYPAARRAAQSDPIATLRAE